MTNETLKGINLGGWLVLEKWMTPAVFDGTDAIDEYSLTQSAEGRARIEAHHETFIQEADFAWLRDNHVDAVRIPVGYWLFESDQNYIPHVQYLDWAMDMALKYDLEVLIDMHGLPGSQNGRDHSGKSGPADWFKQADYRRRSVDVVEQVARRYADHPKFWGIEVINEPFPKLFNLKLRAYYKACTERLAPVLRGHTRMVFSDSFTPRLMSGALRRFANVPVTMDIHVYQPWRQWVKFTSIDFFLRWLGWQKKLHRRLAKVQPVIIGEWSGVIRHEDLEKIPADKRDAVTKRFIDRQLKTFDGTAAWFYWSYKTAEPGTWNYRSLVEAGVL